MCNRCVFSEHALFSRNVTSCFLFVQGCSTNPCQNFLEGFICRAHSRLSAFPLRTSLTVPLMLHYTFLGFQYSIRIVNYRWPLPISSIVFIYTFVSLTSAASSVIFSRTSFSKAIFLCKNSLFSPCTSANCLSNPSACSFCLRSSSSKIC